MGAIPDAEAALARIDAESSRMSQIVEDLLVLAHLDARRPLARSPVDMAELVTDAVDAARATAPGREIVVDVRAAPVVDGDEGRLHRVVSNPGVNAVRHTPDDAHVGVVVDLQGTPPSSLSATTGPHGAARRGTRLRAVPPRRRFPTARKAGAADWG